MVDMMHYWTLWWLLIYVADFICGRRIQLLSYCCYYGCGALLCVIWRELLCLVKDLGACFCDFCCCLEWDSAVCLGL